MPARVSKFALTAALIGLAAALPNYGYGYPDPTGTGAPYPVGTGAPYPSYGYVPPTDYYGPPITYTDVATKTQYLTLTSTVPCAPYTSNGAVYSTTQSEYVTAAVMYNTAVYTQGCDDYGNCYGHPKPTATPYYDPGHSHEHRYPYDADQGMYSYGLDKSGNKYYVDDHGKAYYIDQTGKTCYVTIYGSDKPYYVDDEEHKSYYMDDKLEKAYYVDSYGTKTYITKELYEKDTPVCKYNDEQGMYNYGYDESGNSYYVNDSGKPYIVDKTGTISYIEGLNSTTPYYVDDYSNKSYYVDEKLGTAYSVDKSGKTTYIKKSQYGKDYTPEYSVQEPVDTCEAKTVYVTVTKTVGASTSSATGIATTYDSQEPTVYGDVHDHHHDHDHDHDHSKAVPTDNHSTYGSNESIPAYGEKHGDYEHVHDDYTQDADYSHKHHDNDYDHDNHYGHDDDSTYTDSSVPCTTSTSSYIAVPTCVPGYGVTCPEYPTYSSTSAYDPGYVAPEYTAASSPSYPNAPSYDPGYVAPQYTSTTSSCTQNGSYATPTPNSYA